MRKNNLVAPVVKWVGGKRQLLDEITPRLPKRITSYCEPFLGGGAALFFIQFMLSNSATKFVKDLYKDYNISIVQVKRTINSNASKRGSIEEVLARNYR